MIIKTSGFPEIELPDEELVGVPYVTSMIKHMDGSMGEMYMVFSDTPMYYVENFLDVLDMSYSGGAVWFNTYPTNFLIVMFRTEDGTDFETQFVASSAMGTAEEVFGQMGFAFAMYASAGVSLTPTYSNYDMYYASIDENGAVTPDSRIVYIGDMSEQMMLSAPSSAFQYIADFVRASFGNSDSMNSTTLLEKIKNINAINVDIITAKYTPNEECISLLNGVHGSNFSNTEATKIKEYFFADDTELVSVDLPEVVETGGHVFQNCSSLTNVNLPKLTKVGSDTFRNCTSIVSLSLPELKETGSGCFFDCTALKNVNLPNLGDLGMGSTFENCTSLEQLVLPKCYDMGNYTFEGCTKLKVIDFHRDIPNVNQYYFANAPALQAVILRSTTMSTLYSSSVTGTFNGTPIKEGKGFIYVPRELLTAYKTDSLWSKWASYFRPLEDYTVDGTRMGELDWSKIE